MTRGREVRGTRGEHGGIIGCIRGRAFFPRQMCRGLAYEMFPCRIKHQGSINYPIESMLEIAQKQVSSMSERGLKARRFFTTVLVKR